MKEDNIDAWIISDHRNKNPLGRRLLGEFTPFTRQYFIIIHATGQIKIIRPWIEGQELDQLKTKSIDVIRYKTLEELRGLLGHFKFDRITMDFDSFNPEVDFIPTGQFKFVQRALAGKSKNIEILSSRDYLQIVNAVLTADQLADHRKTAKKCSKIMRQAYAFLFQKLTSSAFLTEKHVSDFILSKFKENELTTDHAPIVAVGSNTANPHHSSSDTPIKKNQLVLIDLWAKSEIYADMTWMGYTGDQVPKDYTKLFAIIQKSQEIGLNQIKPNIPGYLVDLKVRDYIKEQGYAKYFTHRTGHSIDTDVHGQGANLDNFETVENRRLIPGLISSVEPGIYLPGQYGIRSEIDIVITNSGYEITTDQQTDILCV